MQRLHAQRHHVEGAGRRRRGLDALLQAPRDAGQLGLAALQVIAALDGRGHAELAVGEAALLVTLVRGGLAALAPYLIEPGGELRGLFRCGVRRVTVLTDLLAGRLGLLCRGRA